MMRKLVQFAWVLASVSAGSAAAGPLIVDAGRGNGVQFAALGTALLDRRDVSPESPWQLDRTWIARAAYWNAEHPRPYGKHLWDFSIMPTLRLAPRGDDGLRPFFEAAVGAHLLSTTRIDNRDLSTAFQFGEQLAIGVRMRGRVPIALSLRGEHVSNGGIKQPNPGVTFAAIRLQLDWP